LLTFDHESVDLGEHRFRNNILFDISDPKNPSQKKRWELEGCQPINAVMRSGFQYFAVSCAAGQLFVGQLKDPREESELHHVRDYPGASRRALYLDKQRETLLLFTTDMGRPSTSDTKLLDKGRLDEVSRNISGEPNDIPDSYEQSRLRMLNLKENSSVYQFMVYDLKAGASEGFPLKTFQSIREEESHWLYFSLTDRGGTSEDEDITKEPNLKFYRTNFWEAKSDPSDENSFYLSHRGFSTLSDVMERSNNIVKVTYLDPVNGLRPKKDADGKIIFSTTASQLKFQRVYGFKGEAQKGDKNYLGSFVFTKVDGDDMLLVNSYRDMVDFEKAHFSMSAQSLQTKEIFSAVVSENMSDAYFQLALGRSGFVLSTSFFDHSLVLLQVPKRDEIVVVKKIK
ncbi:MAG: hypothetical protein KA436_12310, partial [Oligoflexales bacterium]|nr:hypothetical protein [Oligoflexales bacterium]